MIKKEKNRALFVQPDVSAPRRAIYFFISEPSSADNSTVANIAVWPIVVTRITSGFNLFDRSLFNRTAGRLSVC